MDDISFFGLGGLFLLALIAGTIDAMVGGGGLLTVPGLMASGLSPVAALATNKFQGIFSTLSATIHFWRMGKLRLRDHWIPALTAFAGSIVGALSVSFLDQGVLRILIPFLLIGIALWILCSPKLGEVPRAARLSFAVSNFTLIPLIGFYNGFFGPGTGTFFAMGLVSFLGLRLDEATMRAKIYNFMSSVGACLFFLFGGQIAWLQGAVMAIGMVIGGNIGARMVLRHGAGLLKPLLVVVSLSMSLKLLWQEGLLQKVFGF
ncbi:MAG: TSUP family transporter [Alphaproteobacteria bacterium]